MSEGESAKRVSPRDDDPVSEGESAVVPTRSLLRVLRGEPTPEELAALVAVVVARRAGAAATAPTPRARSAWGDPAGAVRRPVHPNPDGWRARALPR